MIQDRLEYLRDELRAERISYRELVELNSLAEHIDKGDVELLQAAGVPEKQNTMLTNEEIADHLLGDMEAYEENIRDIILGRLMGSSGIKIYWDAWFRGAEGKDLEDADRGIIYKPQ